LLYIAIFMKPVLPSFFCQTDYLLRIELTKNLLFLIWIITIINLTKKIDELNYMNYQIQ
jgi:hypothetical protein